MPVELYYDKKKDALFGIMRGLITIEENENALNTIMKSDQYPPDIRTLWDVREQDFTNIDADFEMRLIELRKKYPERGNARMALVVSTDLGFGMSRMYQNLSANLPQNIMVFRDYADAEKWLLNPQ